ncbi:MAG: response regulator transcription factor [Spirochaetaceae bacterium]|jgi:DNA-binding NarL/FixJ family response regulator|nr:response regulator transcription factor [Spirochaetaceae bacterium]
MISIVAIAAEEADLNGILARFSSQNDFLVRGRGKNGYDALKLVEKMRPDVAVLDICLDMAGGLELIPLLKRKSPQTALLFLSARYDESAVCEAVIREDVRGYLLKNADMDSLIFAVRRASEGGRFISPGINEQVYRILAKLLKTAKEYPTATPQGKAGNAALTRISATELRIFASIGQGYSTKEIAEELRLAPGTVRNYISSAMQKTGLRQRTEIPLFALKNGMIKQL